MSNYTKATNFLAKDSLAPGDPLKIVRGSEIDAEFEAIETAVATKANSADVYSKSEVYAKTETYSKAELDAAIDSAKSILSIETSYSASTAPGAVVSVATGFTLDTGLAAGTVFNIYNNSAADITITQGSGLTLRYAGSSSTGDRIIGLRGLVSVLALSTTEYVMSGAGMR